jgi:hypothetical protein
MIPQDEKELKTKWRRETLDRKAGMGDLESAFGKGPARYSGSV